MIRLALGVLSLLTIVPQTASATRDYWQQRVKYKIDVTLIDSIHSLDGKLSVQYFNNSPDTLHEVYFHLYYLAFQPGSMMQVRATNLNSGSIGPNILKMKPEDQGKYRIDQITTDAGNATHEITGTVMKVTLPKPLLPNTSTTISFTYFEQIPKQTRRGGWMSSEGVEYSMAQWYPKIAEYDESGWNANEYIAREFYGVWGDFDVSITLPATFTVAASGQVQNPQEVGHGYEKIAVGEKSGQSMPDPDLIGMRTWKWRAENVHDFAWVADKTYIHDWATIRDSITIHAIYKTSVMNMWKNALKYTEFMINTMSDLYYPYPYRNFYNTHAGDGGMEYPQLVQNTGYRNELSMAGITAHEGAHQWFYGILGNNEIREAYLDEGFTSYATTQIMVKQFGNEQQYPGTQRSWLDWFIPLPDNKGDNYRGYLSLAKSGYEEPLTIPHDWYREDVGAGEVYSKMQAIVTMLEYTLGESTFDRGMKEYFNRWKFKHPKLTDFQRVMEDVSKTDLDWFFDQWFSTDRTVNYMIRDVESEKENGQYRTTVKLRNLDLAVMPIDLNFTYKDGTTGQATIPLAVHQGAGYKKPESQMFFPPWDWVAKDYEASILTPKEVEMTEIDTSWRLQDVNRLNNRFGTYYAYGFIPVDMIYPHQYWSVWKQLDQRPPLDGVYHIFRPIVLPVIPYLNPLGDFPGVFAGFGMKQGAFLLGEMDFKAYVRWMDDPYKNNTRLEFRLKENGPLDWAGRLVNLNYFLGLQNGLASAKFTLEKTVRPTYLNVGSTHKLRAYLEGHSVLPKYRNALVDHSMEIPYDFQYDVDLPWEELNTRVVGVGWNFLSEGKRTSFDVYAESSFWGSSRSYGKTRLTIAQSIDLFWGMRSTLRFNAGFSKGHVPYERRFFAKTADIAAHQFSDTYQAYRWWTRDKAMLRGGAGLISSGDLKEFDKQTENPVGGQMAGINFDIDAFALPYVPQARIGIHLGAAWIADRKPETFKSFLDKTQLAGGLSLNLDLKSFLPWQLHGVLEQYAPTPGFTFAGEDDIYSGSSF